MSSSELIFPVADSIHLSTYLHRAEIVFFFFEKMHSDGLLQFLSAQDNNGDNYFHEACRGNSLDHFERVVKFVEYPIPAILTQRNSSGEQCTHIIAKSQKHYAVEMMKIVMDLGADINGKEKFSGFTPLHLCVWKKNYELAEWLCQVPWIDLDARDHKGHTAWHMAYVNADFKMINILRWSRTEPKFISVKASKEWSDDANDLIRLLSDLKQLPTFFNLKKGVGKQV